MNFSPASGCAHRDGCLHRWSEYEDQEIQTVVERGESWSALASRLGRSYSSVTHRASRLRTIRRPQREWTEAEVELLRELAGEMSCDVGERLGRSGPAVVYTRARQLGVSGRQRGGWPIRSLSDETPYGPVWHRTIRPAALERDGYRCQEPECAIFTPSGSGLVVHHIVPWALSRDDCLTNLVTLCYPHHGLQVAHRWTEVTPEQIETLPVYQKSILSARED